jgi:hypothetical protein
LQVRPFTGCATSSIRASSPPIILTITVVTPYREESGLYWPFGEPSSVLERRPNYPLFMREMELRRLLTDQPEEKRQLPRSRLPDLADALRRLGHLPDRNAQLQALRELPEFREFKITFADFREAARRLPRNPGRKSQRKS